MCAVLWIHPRRFVSVCMTAAPPPPRDTDVPRGRQQGRLYFLTDRPGKKGEGSCALGVVLKRSFGRCKGDLKV